MKLSSGVKDNTDTKESGETMKEIRLRVEERSTLELITFELPRHVWT